VPSPVQQDRIAPPGVRAPPATSAKGSVRPGPSKVRHSPPSGFLTPSAGCSPFGLADSLGPLPLMGFSLGELFRTARPRRVAASAAPLRPRCSTVSNSEEYEVESSAASKALEPLRPGPTAVVPEPASPLRSTSSSGHRSGFRPCGSPPVLESSASGRTMTRRTGTTGCSDSPRTSGSSRDPQLPWGSC
jgi:hypothetical protein